MPSAVTELVQRADALLRGGHASGVPYLLRGVNFAKLAREERLPLAQICRRAGLFTLGLRALTPVLADRDARDLEKAEYAALLMKIGSIEEAIGRLGDVRDPRGRLYLGFCHLNRWDFAAAVPTLEAYLDDRPAPYDALIAKVNLASALIALDRHQSAADLVSEGLEIARTERYGRLLANLLEMRAQIALAAGDLAAAERDLALALDLIGRQKTNDQLYLLKWRAVIEARRDGETAALDEFRDLAKSRGEFESVREAEYQKLKIVYDEHLAQSLHFGTPWPWFRERLAREVPQFRARPTYQLGAGSELHLGRGLIDRLVATLAQDFYAPWSLGRLFARLYPGEHYHYLHSPNRVHQLIYRARAAGLTIEEIDGRFRLILEQRSLTLGARPLSRLERVRADHGDVFSAADARETLELSEPTVRRLLGEALETHEIERTRAGRAVRYKFVA